LSSPSIASYGALVNQQNSSKTVNQEVRDWAAQQHLSVISHRRSAQAIVEALSLWASGVVVGTQIGGWLGRIIGWLVIGASLIRLQYLFHEAAHRSIFRISWMNDLFGAILGSIALVPHAAYRAHHIEHHGNTRVDHAGRSDPEAFYDEVNSRVTYLTTIVFGGAYLSGWYSWQVIRAVAHCPVPWLRSEHFRSHLRNWGPLSSLGSLGLLTACITPRFGPTLVTWWLIPVAIFLSSMFTLLGFSEHHGVPRNSPVLFASSTLTSNPIYRWLSLNAGYHRAHHLLPNTAFSCLPMLEQQIINILQTRGVHDDAPRHRGIVSFHWRLWKHLPWRA
jgi:fatty acid desaturase